MTYQKTFSDNISCKKKNLTRRVRLAVINYSLRHVRSSGKTIKQKVYFTLLIFAPGFMLILVICAYVQGSSVSQCQSGFDYDPALLDLISDLIFLSDLHNDPLGEHLMHIPGKVSLSVFPTLFVIRIFLLARAYGAHFTFSQEVWCSPDDVPVNIMNINSKGNHPVDQLMGQKLTLSFMSESLRIRSGSALDDLQRLVRDSESFLNDPY